MHHIYIKIKENINIKIIIILITLMQCKNITVTHQIL